MRVLRITGLPSMTAALISTRPLVFAQVPVVALPTRPSDLAACGAFQATRSRQSTVPGDGADPLGRLTPRNPDAEVSLIGDLEAALEAASGEAAPSAGPDVPGDAPDEKLLVVGARFLTEDLAAPGLRLADPHVLKTLDLIADAGGIGRGLLSRF